MPLTHLMLLFYFSDGLFVMSNSFGRIADSFICRKVSMTNFATYPEDIIFSYERIKLVNAISLI